MTHLDLIIVLPLGLYTSPTFVFPNWTQFEGQGEKSFQSKGGTVPERRCRPGFQSKTTQRTSDVSMFYIRSGLTLWP